MPPRTVDVWLRNGQPLNPANTHPTLPRTRHPLILIHGFNTSAYKAHKRYTSFTSELGRAVGRGGLTPDLVVHVHWPGDLPYRLFSPASYPWKIKTARETGAKLDALLQAAVANGAQSISIVAHSLGCRVACALLHNCAQSLRDRFETVCLMAAAVPVDETFRVGGVLADAPARPRDLWVLYSAADGVLANDFPLGEGLGRSLARPEAVGLHGRPFTDYRAVRYNPPRRNCEKFNTWLDHGEYWSGGAARAGKVVAHALEPANRLPLPIHRPIPRVLPTYQRILHRFGQVVFI